MMRAVMCAMRRAFVVFKRVVAARFEIDFTVALLTKRTQRSRDEQREKNFKKNL